MNEKTYLNNDATFGSPFFKLYVASNELSTLVVIDGNCEIVVYDIASERTLFMGDISFCLNLDVSGNYLTISDKDGDPRLEKSKLTYSFCKVDDAYELLCTDFQYLEYYGYKRLTSSQIDQLVNFGKYSVHSSHEAMIADDFYASATTLLIAYIQGSKEALDILNTYEFYYDGSLGMDMDYILNIISAFDSHQRWKKLFGK